jgi:hypothetical protein
LREARAIANHQIEELRAGGYAEPAARVAAGAAVTEAELGNSDEARKYARLSQTLFQGRSNLTKVALAQALAGDAAAAQKTMDGLARQHPSDTIVQRIFIPLVLALRQSGEHHGDPTLSELGPTRRYEEGSFWGFEILYVRGLTQLKNHQPAQAADAFRQIVEHRGIYSTSPEWALAHLGLARAYASQAAAPQTGTKSSTVQGGGMVADILANARLAYEDFFELWKNADPDIPLLKQARTEYANLLSRKKSGS